MSPYRWPLARSSRIARSPQHERADASARALIPIAPSAGLGKVAILVPEHCAEGIRQFAQELRAQHQTEPTPTRLGWRAPSPSAELMVIPELSARFAVRDAGAPGADRFLWAVTVLEELNPVAEGRAKERAEARWLAEAAVAAYFPEPSDRGGARNG